MAEWQRIIGERKAGNTDAKGLKARKNVDACLRTERNRIFPRVRALPDGRWRETNEYSTSAGTPSACKQSLT